MDYAGCAPNKPSPPSLRRQRAPDADRTGLADPPEDWPAASLRDTAAVTSREPQSRKARVRLVTIKLRRRLELEQQVVDRQAGLTRAVNEADYTDTRKQSKQLQLLLPLRRQVQGSRRRTVRREATASV